VKTPAKAPIEETKIEPKNDQEEEEYEYYEETPSQVATSEKDTRVLEDLESLKREELRKLRRLLRQNKEIPRIVII
jgi:hypothetical protein